MSRSSFMAFVLGAPPRGITIDGIIAQVAEKSGIPASQIKSRIRRFNVAHARQEVMRLAHATGRWSMSEIGRQLGRDASSVRHGIAAARGRAGK